MSCKNIKQSKWLFHLALASLMIAIFFQPANALGTSITVLDRAIVMISSLFNIESLQSNSYIQEGFLKFALFVVTFSVSFLSLQKAQIFKDAQGKKSAGVVALAFSLIGVFMMPHEWLLATGGAITTIMSSLIFLGFFIGTSIVAVFVLRPKSGDDKVGFAKNIIGLLMLFLLLSLLDEWALFVGLPVDAGVSVGGSFVIRAYAVLVSWTYVLISLLVLVKIFQFFSIRGEGGKDKSSPEEKKREKKKKQGPKPEAPKEPKQPKEPEKKRDFSEQLRRLASSINECLSLVNKFFDSCNQILITHHNHVNSGRGYEEPLPDVSEEQWQENNRLMERMANLGNEINNQINAIASHTDYGNIVEAQNSQFMDLLNEWSNLQSRLMGFINDFRRRYEDAELPGR
jgi:hypothetical protein